MAGLGGFEIEAFMYGLKGLRTWSRVSWPLQKAQGLEASRSACLCDDDLAE